MMDRRRKTDEIECGYAVPAQHGKLNELLTVIPRCQTVSSGS